MYEIKINPLFAKLILRVNPFLRFRVMRRGYYEDYRNFTELVWDDDKDLDFNDQKSYPEFQVWYV